MLPSLDESTEQFVNQFNLLEFFDVQFPHELVTYGGNGQVFSNWAQFWLVMYYLAKMGEDQTLSMYSGHPMGLFPSHPNAPRVVITNGKRKKEEKEGEAGRGDEREGAMPVVLHLLVLRISSPNPNPNQCQ